MPKQYWLVKQEPEAYAWSALVKEGGTAWTGVRNFQARNHLRAMKRADRVLYYHSGSEKQVVGVAEVTREAYPDPTAEDGDWSSMDIAPRQALKQPVSLAVIKSDPVLKDSALVKQGRLSVIALTERQFERFLALARTTPH